MRANNFDILEVLEQAYFPQPCTKLVESRCSVYAARPKNCRGYRCKVLRRLEEGELNVEQARAIVYKASSLRSTIRQLLDSVGDCTSSVWTRLEALVKAEELQLESPELSRRHPQLGMHLMMLRRVVDEEFLVKKQAVAAAASTNDSG
jgi:Fe-S-cluster containining protein